MKLSKEAKGVVSELSGEVVRMGDIKKLGKEIKKDHELALELWASGKYYPTLLATLILDKALLNQDLIDQLAAGLKVYDAEQRNQIVDWLLANQLMIGIYQPEHRKRCIELGERLGLYKGEKVSKNCTPSYLPEFIRIEVAKREKK